MTILSAEMLPEGAAPAVGLAQVLVPHEAITLVGLAGTWQVEYCLRALIWEHLGWTLGEFRSAWAAGRLEGDRRAEVLVIWEFLGRVSSGRATPVSVGPFRAAVPWQRCVER